MWFRPLIQNSSRYFSRLKRVKHRTSYFKSTLTFMASPKHDFPQPDKNRKFLRFFIIRECGSTLYVGLAHAVLPTNTKFKLLLLPTQTGMPYTNTHKHRNLHFWVQPSSGSAFPQPDKNRKFSQFFIIDTIIIIIFNFVFSISVQM